MGSFNSCTYLDVVPDGVSKLENAFTMRNQAQKFLYTCYSYMPKEGQLSSDPGLLGGDELWNLENANLPAFGFAAFNIARGLQNSSSPLIDHWGGLYIALRDCNIFLDNINNVADLQAWERDQWIAEVKFLKAYYHFYLVKMYGPVPIIRKNLPIDAGIEEVKVQRNTVDECFSYIVELLDEAIPVLPSSVRNPNEELGRITKAIAVSFKAKVLVTAASPVFNGNTDQASLMNKDGRQLFNQTKEVSKWEKALVACEQAIQLCENELGMKLYTYPGNPQFNLSAVTLQELTLRNAFAEKWNDDIIWANTQSVHNFTQQVSVPRFDPRYPDIPILKNLIGAPIKVAEQFYTKNGIPLADDKTLIYNNRYDIQNVGAAYRRYMREGAQTINMHFDREPRFYAYLGFDTGIWYGEGIFNDANPTTLYAVAARRGQSNQKRGSDDGPITGYYIKKYVHFQNTTLSATSYSMVSYPWPLIRLSDLFLLYAEAANEAGDNELNRSKAIVYLNKVRNRAGIPNVEDAWTNYSLNPNKFRSQNGLRQIIHQERLNELAFEGHRYWDIRRWKTAPEYYNLPIQAWDLTQSAPQDFYRKVLIAKQTFTTKDYFWPIRLSNLTVNNNLVQNVGW
ncbi:RagB/SusD family nutrient uptake outer membrane protein [Pedobacter sp. ASV1-7]|uniref:RagB/SusD family nutrient uptake outer membrane protein n=1 Tax=Pedobacter sp. ASV1-7 TaxID=3145237 RepID=UPI0032E86D52